MSLIKLRTKIDKIDNKLARLLNKRMDLSLEVAETKRKEGLSVYHPKREEEILNKVKKSGKHGDYIAEIYRFLMACSREVQQNSLKNEKAPLFNDDTENTLNVCGEVACYGDLGAFTHLALIGGFGEKNVSPKFFDSFEKVFKAVVEDEVNFGIVPVENSSAGSVREVYDLILKYQTFIVSSVTMPVRHNLLGQKDAKLSDIKTVFSHHQALSQCEDFLRAKKLDSKEYLSTADAVKMVAKKKDLSIAAIGSAYCGKICGLKVLKRDIQSFEGNKTRFIVISKTPIITEDREKISLVFSLPHTPGSLQKILTRFSLHGLNLTKLESSAGSRGDFETTFYLDFLGDSKDDKTLSLLLDLKEELPDFNFLGNYKEFILK